MPLSKIYKFTVQALSGFAICAVSIFFCFVQSQFLRFAVSLYRGAPFPASFVVRHPLKSRGIIFLLAAVEPVLRIVCRTYISVIEGIVGNVIYLGNRPLAVFVQVCQAVREVRALPYFYVSIPIGAYLSGNSTPAGISSKSFASVRKRFFPKQISRFSIVVKSGAHKLDGNIVFGRSHEMFLLGGASF